MIRLLILACALIPASASAGTGSRALPSVSPDGNWIAFVSDSDSANRVYVVGSGGEGARRIPTRGQSVRWFGMRSLAITGTDADSNKVFSARLDGSSAILASPPVHGRNPRVSPDGKHVLYSTGPWSSTALVVASTVERGEMKENNTRIVAGGRASAWNGEWSPDGKQIAYTYGDSTRVLQVHVVNADGSGDHAVTHLSAKQGSAQMPAWSPDGKKLAFQVNQHAVRTAHIWIVDLSSGEAHPIASHADGILDEAPSWFPDGKRLAFQSTRSGFMEIWTMGVDGSHPAQVTGEPD